MGFEPTIPVKGYLVSSEALSTTQPTLQMATNYHNLAESGRLILTMKTLLYYLPRILSLIIVGFFALFILEGFSPEFGWPSALAHLGLTLMMLVAATVAWEYPKLGGWVFLALSLSFAFLLRQDQLSSLIIAGTFLLTGLLFLVQKSPIDRNTSQT